MCNLYTQTRAVDAVRQLFAKAQIPIRFPEGIPNLEPRDVCITDPAPIVRASSFDPDGYELVIRRWSWPGPGGKPVFNFRSEGREFTSGRCLILADGFYEFTSSADPKQKRKDRWLFTRADAAPFCIAGLWRADATVGEAFTMLTTEPGPDIAPFHNRQVCLLNPSQWKSWLTPAASASELLKPAPAGELAANKA
jgi:putative SOS response-associated peptidase YedK